MNNKYKKQTFDESTRLDIVSKYAGRCVNCRKPATEIHHLIANTKLNVRLYGQDKIQSAENGVCVCHQCHNKHSIWDKNLKPIWKQNSKLGRTNENF